jgi:type IV secretion system protein VirB11
MTMQRRIEMPCETADIWDAAGGEAIYLQRYLAPFAQWLSADDVCEILVNRCGEIWVERAGATAMERHDAPDVDDHLLSRLAYQIARISHQGVSRESPLLAATLPGGSRVQMVLPPAARAGPVLTIRKHAVQDMTLEDCLTQGMAAPANKRDQNDSAKASLSALLAQQNYAAFLRSAVQQRKTILLSGGTSSGKTTLLNAMLKEIAAQERIIAIEDTPELKLQHDNSVGLIAVAGDQGETRVTIDDLLRASLRMRPDRLIVGELRGAEAVTFLRAINTGHPGSISTLHATSADGAFEQIAFMATQAGLGLNRADMIAYAQSMIDIVVQLERRNGVRSIAHIWAPEISTQV